MTGKRSLVSVATAMTVACAIAAEPESPGGYSSDLSRVYWGYHQVLVWDNRAALHQDLFPA